LWGDDSLYTDSVTLLDSPLLENIGELARLSHELGIADLARLGRLVGFVDDGRLVWVGIKVPVQAVV
jgi:hypothetical protein